MKSIITSAGEQFKDKKWTPEFKQNTIPSLLAGLAAVWSKLESKDIECTKEVLKPHCIQILCILKLLSVDTSHENIDSQFAQVLTGQGKSIILGLLSSLLALMEYKVQIVCYIGEVRVNNGRKEKTSFCIIDAQSVKNTDTAEEKGYDVGKKISGIKRHIAVDTQGLPHAIHITAEATDRSNAVEMVEKAEKTLSEVKNILVDAGYTGENFATQIKTTIGATVEVIKRSELHIKWENHQIVV
ncbi:transposase [Trichonephila inaurata madagascariensis]|uniref:Transposase n=1 Tax=Trichonephila inaurata madagascariensis TaxID=2747483 RepID=A0A8X6IGR0_9ARAC|nr:transposase [Trichonephila inaurata madagascariensis]